MQLVAPAGDAGLHRADRYPEGLGDLGVVEVGDVTQHDRGAELLRELVERGVDGHAVGDRRHLAIGERVDGLGRDTVVADDVQAGAALAPAQLVERGVRGDPVRPRRELGATVEARQAPDDADHRLLGRVVGVAGRPGDAPAHGVDAVVVAAQQLVEGAPVAGLRGGDEVAVLGGRGHQPNVISPIEPRFGLAVLHPGSGPISRRAISR